MTVNSALLLEYRCRAKGCLLLRVWQTPKGPEYLAPGHRLSRLYRINETEDWVGRLDDYPEVLPWLPLACDHVRGLLRVFDIRKEAAGATPGSPLRVLWPPKNLGHTRTTSPK
jgi:hypothetical protein